MGYTYTPAYYSSFQDSITSLCKSILPFSFKKRGLPETERRVSKQQTDFLKWQQDAFHQILNLMGLHREGILPESEVSEFKSRLLVTLIASKGAEREQPVILRDKLLFLQELVYAKCISDEEYHASKRPLLERLAVQGGEVEAGGVNLGGAQTDDAGEEWSVIDLGDEQRLISKDGPANKPKPGSSAIRQIKGAAAVLGFGGSSQKQGKGRAQKSIFEDLGSSGTPNRNKVKKKKKGLLGFICKEDTSEGRRRSAGGDSEDDTSNLGGEGPDTSHINNKLHSHASASDFFINIDKVLGDNINKELTRIQAQLSSKNTSLQFSNDEIEIISTKLPVDKADLQKFFPKSWCDQHGDVVLDVVKKEFKGHVRDMESTRYTSRDQRKNLKLNTWATFDDDDDDDDDENSQPNMFSHSNHHGRTNPFLQNKDENTTNGENKRNQSFLNPFWNSTNRGS